MLYRVIPNGVCTNSPKCIDPKEVRDSIRKAGYTILLNEKPWTKEKPGDIDAAVAALNSAAEENPPVKRGRKKKEDYTDGNNI